MKWLKKLLKKETGPFAAGDKVTAFGNKGFVKGISKNGMFIEVQFEGAPATVIFYLDGKLFAWSNRPILEKL